MPDPEENERKDRLEKGMDEFFSDVVPEDSVGTTEEEGTGEDLIGQSGH